LFLEYGASEREGDRMAEPQAFEVVTESAQIRYVGTLSEINKEKNTISLSNVRIYGTEDRPAPQFVPQAKMTYQNITFRGSDIAQLNKVRDHNDATPPADPAIVLAEALAQHAQRPPVALYTAAPSRADPPQVLAVPSLQAAEAVSAVSAPQVPSPPLQPVHQALQASTSLTAPVQVPTLAYGGTVGGGTAAYGGYAGQATVQSAAPRQGSSAGTRSSDATGASQGMYGGYGATAGTGKGVTKGPRASGNTGKRGKGAAGYGGAVTGGGGYGGYAGAGTGHQAAGGTFSAVPGGGGYGGYGGAQLPRTQTRPRGAKGGNSRKGQPKPEQ